MSSPPASFAAPVTVAQIPVSLAQTRREAVDSAHLEEIERLMNGGRHVDHSGDFTLFVVIPMVILLSIVVLGRRLMS